MLNALKSFFSGSSPAAVGGPVGPASKTLVVDPGGGVKNRERLPPGAQVKILQRLSRFAEREKLNVSAVYEGKDLRAVSHGTEFQGVKVFFTQGQSELSKVIAEAVRAAPRTPGGVTVVSDDPEMEAAGKAAGANVMRLSSLEKAVEGGIRRGGGGGGNRSGRGDSAIVVAVLRRSSSRGCRGRAEAIRIPCAICSTWSTEIRPRRWVRRR